MKSLVAIGILVLGLSLCNLLGRRGANNSNSTTNTETTSMNNSNGPTPESVTTGSGAPPAAPPGVHTLNANENNAASVPPPPAKPTPTLTWVGVLNGKAIKLVQPPYPPIAKSVHAAGEVRVQVVVDEEGNVILAAPESGHPLLQAAALTAARQSKFTPTKLSGQPVKVRGEVIYNFVAQ